jgi:hypothetical protein
MNPTSYLCPSDISNFVTTDYRQNKSVYENVVKNNEYRSYLQRFANEIRANNIKKYMNQMDCICDDHDSKRLTNHKNSSSFWW